MRIAFISYEFPPDSSTGGIATYVLQASRLLANRGHEVEVFAATPDRSRTECRDGTLVHWIGEANRKDFAVCAGHAFANRHRVASFDVVEGPEFNADARIARQLCPRVPLVVRLHTPSILLYPYERHRGPWFYFRWNLGNAKALLRATTRLAPPESWHWDDLSELRRWDSVERQHCLSADLIASPSLSLMRWAKAEWHVPEARIVHSPHPYVPSDDFLKISTDAGQSDRLTIGYFGRLDRRKGIESFTTIVPYVCSRFPGTVFRFVGAVGESSACPEKYDSWLRRRVGRFRTQLDFTGKVPLSEIPKYLAEVDICVFPSLWENFPNVCLEAMSAGRPIVASREGGMRDMLNEGECGKLADPWRPQKIAKQITDLCASADMRRKLGDAARSRVLSRYGSDTIGREFEDVFQRAIQISERRAAKQADLADSSKAAT